MAERESQPNPDRTCPRCGSELPLKVPAALCPKCLLRAALPTQAGGEQTEIIPPPLPGAASRGMPMPGDQFGHYQIMRLLGEGGMGAVFEAEDLETGRRVALKVLSQKLDAPEARERFLREGRIAAALNHPNSVYVFGTEEIAGTPVIAMELVAGGTLQERVHQHGPLPADTAVDYTLQIIAGLEAAQRAGILHRDIKPSNCFLNTDGAVKIGDFGLSISTTVRTEPALTSTGSFLGTPAFCAPEQLRGDELNVRSDMYSVGATLFYLLTGRTPFEGKAPIQLLATVLEKPAPSPRQFRPEIPEGLARVVLRCLEKQSGDRFKSYAELRQAIAPYSSTAPTPATLSLRFVAGMMDQIMVSVISMLALWLMNKSPMDFVNEAGKASPKALGMVLVSLGLGLVYYTVFEGWYGAAAGKALCRLRLVGPDRNTPGLGRAGLRALIFVVTPMLPFWLFFGIDHNSYINSSAALKYGMSLSAYAVLALLFSTVRRRNGFAALYDLAAKTRVISRAALENRPELAAVETAPPAMETGRMVGPYHVLETLERVAGMEWLLGFDLRLLRKVWIRLAPPGTPPVPAAERNLGRIGRLRWLTGRRSPEENWDAFEALSGEPLLRLQQSRQPWEQVRFWLCDLAVEIAAATKDGTRPATLALDRVWITGDGRAKLLDFPAPGLTGASIENSEPAQSCGGFLARVAGAALMGRTTATLAVPLPLHARDFLNGLPTLPDADRIATALKPMLQRVVQVTRRRRAAIVAGCLAIPMLFGFGFVWGARMLNEWNRNNPGLMELVNLLQQRGSMNSRWYKDKPHPTDQQFAIYIASHYRSVITNQAAWTGALTVTMIKGDMRRFAEQSIADHPAPSPEEIKDADAAMDQEPFAMVHQIVQEQTQFNLKPEFALSMTGITLFIYVGLPALLAALLFRGGLVLLIARVTFVRADGAPASRGRVFWRAVVAWSPILPGMVLGFVLKIWISITAGVILSTLFLGCLAIVSVALPRRGLPDRIAGTWPVMR
jgi:hypothetical protein